MTMTISKRKYTFLAIGICILIALVVGVFYALLFGKDVFQGAVGSVGGAGGVTVQFDFQRMSGLSGISGQ
jgi:membrane associated rhomboid family serine protease